MRSLLDALIDRPILLDAAMGTRLIGLGLDLRVDDPSLWTVDNPATVRALHEQDIAAGSDALVTNTFGANRRRLASLGRGDQGARVNRAAVELARDAAGESRWVIGDIGPGAVECGNSLREQADSLESAGVDALLLETLTPGDAVSAVGWLRPRTRLPLIVSLVGGADNLPGAGDWPESIVQLESLGADVVGCNCGDLATIGSELARARSIAHRPLIAQPSAGRPSGMLAPPIAFAESVPHWLDAGTRLLGGCCGTTHEHIAAMRRAIDVWRDCVGSTMAPFRTALNSSE